MAEQAPETHFSVEDAETQLAEYPTDSSSSSYETISTDAYPPLATRSMQTNSRGVKPTGPEVDYAGIGRSPHAWETGEEPYWTLDSLHGLSSRISRTQLWYTLLKPSKFAPPAKHTPGVTPPIEIIVGDRSNDTHRVFHMSGSLLASHSTFFAHIYTKAQSMPQIRIHLPDLEPVHFANFVSYVQSNIYFVRAPNGDPIIYHTAAWVLGDQLRADKYRDSALWALHSIFNRNVKILWSTDPDIQAVGHTVQHITPAHIEYLCNNTLADCPLRTLFFDALAACWPYERVRALLGVRHSDGEDKGWFDLYRTFPEFRCAIMGTFQVRNPGRKMLLKDAVVYIDPTGNTWPPKLLEHARRVVRKKPVFDKQRRRELIGRIMGWDKGDGKMWEDKEWTGLGNGTDEQETEPEPMETDTEDYKAAIAGESQNWEDTAMEIDQQGSSDDLPAVKKEGTEETGHPQPEPPKKTEPAKKKRVRFFNRSFTSSKLGQYSFTANDQDEGDVADDERE